MSALRQPGHPVAPWPPTRSPTGSGVVLLARDKQLRQNFGGRAANYAMRGAIQLARGGIDHHHPRTRSARLVRKTGRRVHRPGRAHHQHQIARVGCVPGGLQGGKRQGFAKPHHAGPQQVAAAVAVRGMARQG